MWSHHSSSHGSATSVYIIPYSSSHICCVKLFNAPDWDWANQAAVLVYVYWVLSFFMHYIKDWRIMEAVWHIMRELLYFWKIHVWWSSFDSWATLVPDECRNANACTDACMYICMLVNACAYVSMFAWMHVCMYVCLHDKWFVVRPHIDQNMPTCTLMGIM